jgi:EAL domain-containing protein (putative c-di-GMP-specific phosphodiesterase class I)
MQRAYNTVALNRHRRSVVPRVAMVSLEIPEGNGMDSEEILKVLSYSQLQARPFHLEPVILRGDVDHEGWLARLRKRELKTTQITDALRRGAVEVHFQPIIELATRNLYNVEVLARIRTDEGLMVATEFIDSVYQLGEIVELDSQVFARLREVAPEIIGVTGHLFINVSPVSLLSSDFRELMTTTVEDLRDEGLGMVVVLELTEQAIVEHLDIIHELHKLHDVKFAVDDFGTGYSSLKTLSDLAVAKVISHLKLDGSLIREIVHSRDAYKVVLAIANLARSLDLKVVAEHVESEEVLERLRSIGVELGQGRLFDMPLPLLRLVEGYSGLESTREDPAFTRPELDVLRPYLDKAFTSFYDRLLSNDHFQVFFEDTDQVRELVERQRASFVRSMSESDEELRKRYVELGKLHHHIGVPFPSFMKGADILNEELLSVLAHVSDQGGLVYQSAVFFTKLKNYLARGYLDELVAEEEQALSHSLASLRAVLESTGGPSLAWVQELVDAVRDDRHGSPPRPHAAMAESSDQLHQRVSPYLTRDSARQVLDAYSALHADGESLAFFLSQQEYSSVMMLYRQLHDRVITMHQALEAAGLGG